MVYFAVTREPGPNWDSSRPMRNGGPVGDGMRFLLIIDAKDAPEIEARLAEDPWTPTELLRISSIDRWQILLERGTDGMEA